MSYFLQMSIVLDILSMHESEIWIGVCQKDLRPLDFRSGMELMIHARRERKPK